MDSAGVEIVTSSAVDAPLRWEFARRFTLGGASEGPESFYRLSMSAVAADREGNIHILDTGSNRVVVFDSTGNHVAELGREGDGPGELSAPSSVAVTPGGTVSVFDFGKGGLVRFGSDGRVLSFEPFPLFPSSEQPRHIAAAGEGLFVASVAPSSSQDSLRHALRRVSGGDTVLIADQVVPRPEMVRYPECGGGLSLPRLFERHIDWAPTADAGAMVARSAAYQLEQYDSDGLPVRIVRRARPLRDATRERAESELGDGFTIDFGEGPCTIPPGEMVEGRGFAEHVPWIDRLAVSPDGHIWVSRWNEGPEGRGPTDVFAPTGEYVGTLPSTTPFPAVFLSEKLFGAVETDEFDVDRLVVYRVTDAQ